MRIRSFVALVGLCGMLLVHENAVADDPFAAQVRTTDPLTPEEAQRSFRLPPGFEIQLVASEPEILKPMNIAFDARGRLWITESTEYPYPAPPDRTGRDHVKILEDTTGDGRADKITTFADDLNIPIGIYPYKTGAIVFSIPHVWNLQDTTGDGKADQRDILFGPMGYERDTHGMNNSFRRGFDGWLYACHGFNNETSVSGTDGHTVNMHSGNTFRMRLDGARIEQFTWGQVNPFGMACDRLGNLFTADCHSKPIYQLLRGGYYPSFSKPHDGLGFVPPMMDHLHGSTAIAGLAIYTGENFPPEYRNNTFSGNVMTSRVNRNTLTYHGSTILANEQPDFLTTTDPWFRPVDVRVGPDGALYIADFYNRIIGHYEVPLDHPGRDRHRGRIWRIVYTGDHPESKPPQLPSSLDDAPVERLIAALEHESLPYRLAATDQLTDRIGVSAIEALRQAFRSSEHETVRSHAVWVLFRLGKLTDDILKSASQDTSRDVRVHAMKILSEMADWSPEQHHLALNGLSDRDAFVQRAAADALGQHPHPDNIRSLLALLNRTSEEDTHLRHTIRMAVRNQLRSGDHFDRLLDAPLNEADARAIADIALAIERPESGAFLLQYLRNRTVDGTTLSRYLQHASRFLPQNRIGELIDMVRESFAGQLDFQLERLVSIHNGLGQRGIPAGDSLKEWGAALVEELLDSVEGTASVWRNRPIPEKADPTNPWVLEQRLSADGNRDSWFLGSLPRGEQRTGVLQSAAFPMPRQLRFFVAGHIGPPNQPVDARNFIRLRDAVTQRLLAEATPPRNDTAQEVVWDLREHQGRRGYLEIVDGDDRAAYAWLAVGRFDPEVVPLPEISPHLVSHRQQAAADVVARLQLEALKPRLAAVLASETTEIETRAAMARTLVHLDPESRLSALIPVVEEASVSDRIRNRVLQGILQRNDDSIDALLVEAMKSVPQRVQAAIAERLAEDRVGAETLLDLLEQGHASPRLLLIPAVQERLTALRLDGGDQRIVKLTAQLPSEDEALQQLIAARRAGFASAPTSLERGAELFEKNCAACHQLEGKGTVIGPQLDGIGQRGLERLLEDILAPNRNVDVNFRTTTLVLTNGQVRSGLIRREEGANLVLADTEGKEFSVPLVEIDERIESNTSLMPANWGEVLSEPDFHHLMAFLLSKRVVPVTED